jgi:hypothetical protein
MKREIPGSATQYPGPDNINFIADLRPLVGPDTPIDLNRVIELELKILQVLGSSYTLHFAGTVAKNDEGRPRKDPQPIHPPTQEDFSREVMAERMNEDSVAEGGTHSRNSCIQRISAGTPMVIEAVPSSFRLRQATLSWRCLVA